jgi:hypothetical protein
MRTRFAVILAVLLSSALRGTLCAQPIPYINSRFQIGTLNAGNPPANAVDLGDTNGKSTGKVWAAQGQNGIVVYGKVEGIRPQWARFPNEMSTRTHVNLWFGATPDVPMPEIGWRNQFGDANCEEYEKRENRGRNAEDCATWAARQALYRNQLRRLFVREWQLAPRVSNETFATAAFREALGFATDFESGALRKMEPKGTPFMESQEGSAFQLEIVVPWEAFPPVSSLELSEIYLVVEIAEGDTILASTRPARKQDDPSSFDKFVLSKPVVSRITSCKYPLEGSILSRKYVPAWYYLTANGSIADTFVLANLPVGYRYDPEGLSPIPVWTHRFEKDIGNGNVVCGPELRYLAGKMVWESDEQIDEQESRFRRLADGSYHLRSGPIWGTRSPLGTGRCGACATLSVSVFHLEPLKGISISFTESFLFDPPQLDDADIRFSSDWKTITVYRAAEAPDGKTTWSSQQYCLAANNNYGECGTGPAGPPPRPRQLNTNR